MPRLRGFWGRCVLWTPSAALSAPAHSQILNKNLIVNGYAEAGPAVNNATDPQVSGIRGWTVTGGFSVGKCNGGNFPSDGDYLPVVRGRQLFYGGPGSKPSTGAQTVDLSAGATTIDTRDSEVLLLGLPGFC